MDKLDYEKCGAVFFDGENYTAEKNLAVIGKGKITYYAPNDNIPSPFFGVVYECGKISDLSDISLIYALFYKANNLLLSDKEALAKRLILTAEELLKEQGLILSVNTEIKEIKKYLDGNYHKEISLETLAERYYVSKYNLIRNFKSVYGVTPLLYLRNIRIEKAKELLKDKSVKINRIAEAVGYSDDLYFRKVFKSVVGTTPIKFREEIE